MRTFLSGLSLVGCQPLLQIRLVLEFGANWLRRDSGESFKTIQNVYVYQLSLSTLPARLLPPACHCRESLKTRAGSRWVFYCLEELPMRLQPVTLFGTIALIILVSQH